MDKVCIVTGASSGIGEATAIALVKDGAKVMLAARREDRMKALADKCNAINAGSTEYVKVDVSNHAEMVALGQKTISVFGRVDVLVNNAGVMPLSALARRRVDEWDQMIDVNIKGVLYGIDAVLTHMLERGSGHVINVASVAGHRVTPTGAVYAGTKFAVRAISEGLRQETVGKVRSTIISPGAVTTELGNSIKDEVTRAQLMEKFSGFEFLASEDIAATIVFAINQPERSSVSEIVVRPTEQPF